MRTHRQGGERRWMRRLVAGALVVVALLAAGFFGRRVYNAVVPSTPDRSSFWVTGTVRMVSDDGREACVDATCALLRLPGNEPLQVGERVRIYVCHVPLDAAGDGFGTVFVAAFPKV
ncbi:MAG: hypothetical protein JO079_04505 [Frankiaceae bacterium]|nr:hypothetical protein [Frankiaceae bacterium]